MTEPIVFISHFQIREGKLEAYRRLHADVARQLETDKPRTLVFLTYVNEDGSETTVVHVFADAESMDLHVQGSEERSRAAYEFLVPAGWEVYGRPSENVIRMLGMAATSAGVTLQVLPGLVGGFLRPTSAG